MSENDTITRIYHAFISHVTTGQERRGQAWMNALAEVDYDLYQQISGTDADCFYNDNKIEAFKAKVFTERNS